MLAGKLFQDFSKFQLKKRCGYVGCPKGGAANDVVDMCRRVKDGIVNDRFGGIQNRARRGPDRLLPEQQSQVIQNVL